LTPSSTSSRHCREKANDPRPCSSSTSSAEDEKKCPEEENDTWSERKQNLIRKIEKVQAKHHDEKLAEVQDKKDANHRRETAVQHQAKIHRQIEEIRSKQAEFRRQIEEIERQQVQVQRQRDCLLGELKLHNHSEQSNREREQRADRQHNLNLEQIQSQADELKRKLKDYDKERPMGIQREEKSAQQVYFNLYLLCCFLSHIHLY